MSSTRGPVDGQVDKIIRIVSASTTSWEAAARAAIDEAAKSIHDLHTAKVVQQDMVVRDDQLEFRLKLEVAFQLDRNRIDATGLHVQVRRYLIVANQTLASPGLHQLVNTRVAKSPCEFHVLVPQALTPSFHADPAGFYDPSLRDGITQSRETARRDAEERLESFRRAFADVDATFTGEVSIGDPVMATRRVMERSSFDEIIVSTLPAGVSRWLKLDLPNRLERAFDVPVTPLIQDETVSV